MGLLQLLHTKNFIKTSVLLFAKGIFLCFFVLKSVAASLQKHLLCVLAFEKHIFCKKILIFLHFKQLFIFVFQTICFLRYKQLFFLHYKQFVFFALQTIIFVSVHVGWFAFAL